MNIIEFIYSIISRYAPISTSRIEQLKDEATQWYAKEVLNKDEPTGIAVFIKKYGEEWYSKTFLALAFLWAVRAVADYMNPERHENEEF